jgi:putative NADH-flavin reductase
MTQKILVLGATGNTGAQVLDLALARGHQVTAFVRSPGKVTRRDSALAVVPGDPLRADRLAEALAGHDAVVSCLGPPPRDAFRPSTLMAEGAASAVAAMSMAGVRRLAIVSAAMLFHAGISFAFFRWLLRQHARDLLAMEAVVTATALDWTIARPPRLVRTRIGGEERYRSAAGAMPPGGRSLGFRAVAAFLLDCVEQRAHLGEIVGLTRKAGEA